MNSQMIKRIVILAALAIGLGVVVFMQMRPDPEAQGAAERLKQALAEQGQGGATPAAPAKPAAPGVQSQIKEDVNIDDLLRKIRDVDFDYGVARVPRNPMSPLVGVTFVTSAGRGAGAADEALMYETLAQAQKMKLTGIIWDPTNPVAVIDNAIVSEGSELQGGIVVARINRDHVVLTVENTEIVKELKEQ